MATIAVLMPVYNAERYLPECLISLQKQTFLDWVLLAADDASSDRSLKILELFAQKDSRIQVFRNPQNMGVAATLNFLLEQARHHSFAFLARMDADDMAEPQRLQLQHEFLLAHPEIAVVGTFLKMIDENGKELGLRRYPTGADQIRRQILCANPLAHPSVLVRSELFETIGPYRKISAAEDYDLWLRAIAAGFQLENLPIPLLRYRICPEQEKKRNLKPMLHSTLRLQRMYLFRRDFFSAAALLRYCAGTVLELLPASWIMKLFLWTTLRKGGKLCV